MNFHFGRGRLPRRTFSGRLKPVPVLEPQNSFFCVLQKMVVLIVDPHLETSSHRKGCEFLGLATAKVTARTPMGVSFI